MAILSSIEELERIVNQGDLLLVRSKISIAIGGAPTLGVFDKIDPSRLEGGTLRFKKPRYLLKKPIILNGVQEESVTNPLEYGLSVKHFAIGYVGIRDIIKYLKTDDELVSHCEWIRELKRPYVLPKMKTYHYLSIRSSL